MSNPLALFRRYQKAMLAVAAVGAMLAFGILPTVSSYLDSSSSGGGGTKSTNPVVASWKGREIREGDLQNLVGRRQLMIYFQRAAQQLASERGAQPLPGVIPENLSEGSIVETQFWAEQAAEQGIVISDDAVIRHLEGSLGAGVINRNELAALLKNATRQQLTQSQLIEGYRTELAAERMLTLASGRGFAGSITPTPAKALDYFKRMTRRMEAEVMELALDDYPVTEQPSDAEIQSLYDEFKTQLPNPASPDPGFREPTRITVNWLKADFPEILEQEKAKLTDDEIQKYYDENQESFKKLVLPSGDTEAPEDTPEYQPLEDVRDDIANTLARPKATDRVRDAMTQAVDEMRKYYEDFEFWQATGEEGSTPPAAPELNSMASRLGLKSGVIPMVSIYEVDEYELGQAFDFQFVGNQPVRTSFGQKAFRPGLANFSPETILAPTGQDSQFVYWKTEQRDDYIPELSEARPNIVKYWQMKKSAEKAKVAGEAIAADLTKNKQSLGIKFGEDESKEVVETGEFTWMTFGGTPMGPGRPRLSTVTGVEYAGQDFMKDVSKLQSGEATVTLNQPGSRVYVVYMKAVTSSDEDLRQRFLTEGSNPAVRFVAAMDEFETARDWFKSEQDELNFEIKEPETTN